MTAKNTNENLEKEKLEIIKWVTGLKDRTAIERLKMLKEKPKRTDWWDQITEEERAAIEKGLDDIKEGRVKAHKDVKKLYEQWL